MMFQLGESTWIPEHRVHDIRLVNVNGETDVVVVTLEKLPGADEGFTFGLAADSELGAKLLAQLAGPQPPKAEASKPPVYATLGDPDGKMGKGDEQ